MGSRVRHSGRIGTLAAALLLALAAVLAAPAAAQEVIRNYVVDIELMSDGSVEVVETIEVRAEGREIRRGIFRDIPTVLDHGDGGTLRSNLRVIEVLRDGRPEPYFTETIGTGRNAGTRIYAGDANVLLSAGTYTYTLRYTMTRMARSFADYDELYWNATGNFWAFPIERATVMVTLPAGADIGELNAFTGGLGATGQAATSFRTSDNTATFRLDAPLGPREGLTVSVTFDKGVLAEPTMAQRAIWFLSDYRDIILPAVAVILVLLYYYLAWDAVGRDPKKGVIFPRFHAPEGYSPALVHYIHRMGWPNSGWTAFSAALVSLGVKGLVEIGAEGKKTTLRHTGEQPEAPLPPSEQVLDTYLRGRAKFTVDTTSGPPLNTRRQQMIAAVESENRKVYFRNNTLYVVAGVALSAVCLLGLLLTGTLAPVWFIVAGAAGLFIGLAAGLFRTVWRGSGVSRFILIVWFVIFGSNMLGGIGASFDVFWLNAAVLATASIVIINVVFAILMRAPTVQGRKRMDEIDGFRMYLETAEKERLNFADEPEFTISRFERILPYAIALGVEKPWSDRLEGELARHAVVGAEHGYSPHWYRSRSFSSANIGRSVAGIGAGVSAAMISAQPAASSSSGGGGGGGGFSGGGGGGGGGGGW